MSRLPTAQLIARVQRAMSRRDLWRNIWQDCYDYMLPGRMGFFQEIVGRDRTDKIFDDTAVNGIQESASMMIDMIAPAHTQFFRYVPGNAIPQVQRGPMQDDLDDVTWYFHEVLRNSNFHTQLHEAIIDVLIGTCNLVGEQTQDIKHVSWGAIPLTDYTIDAGPDGQPDLVARFLHLSPNDARARGYGTYGTTPLMADMTSTVMSPMATTPEEGKLLKVLDCSYRDWTQPMVHNYHRHVVDYDNRRDMKYEYVSGKGARPNIIGRWAAASGEIYGRGPVLNVLPSTKSVNLAQQLIFENAEMAIGGVWKAPFDGVINFDNIVIQPGTVIPYNPNTRGLEGVESPSRFDVSQLILEQMQRNIKTGLFIEDYDGGGDTPISAAEIGGRDIRRARRIGAPGMRLFFELIAPAVERVRWILQSQGIIQMPDVNGRQVELIPTSPLARAQQNEAITQKLTYVGAVNQVVGPAQAQLLLRGADIVADLTDLYDQPSRYLTSESERQEMLAQAQSLAQLAQAGAQPGSGDLQGLLP